MNIPAQQMNKDIQSGPPSLVERRTDAEAEFYIGWMPKVPAELVTEVKSRYAALPTKAFSGFVQPRLIPVLDAQGKITAVNVVVETDFVNQMLRYGKQYGVLPVDN